MVMATGSVCQQFSGGELSHEAGEAKDDTSAEATALHECLVAYVHALAGGHEPRCGVWVEHSYARARGTPHAPAPHVRVLLAPSLPGDCGDVDVERVEPSPPALPALPAGDPSDCRDDSDADCDDDWEARVTALAPGAVHARLAERALDALRRMRLERLAETRGSVRGEAARSAARRLRLALAGAAAHPSHPAHAPRPGAWLHAALLACMPRAVRRLYDELAAELRRAAPRLAARTLGAGAIAPVDPLAAVGPALGSACSPWLVWLGCGRARLDARWTRRLGALLHTRVLPLAGEAGAPDAWCASAAGSMRAALTDALVEAGERPVILGGIGAGAALATALAGGAAGAEGAGVAGGAAGGARVRGLLLLAPPLLTAEGARDAPDDALGELRLPLLVVAGTGAAACWRGAARHVARGEAAARRVLELRGADDALRMPSALRRRRRLPQHALDAAVAEECARWAIEIAAGAGGAPLPARERVRRPRAPAPSAAPRALDDDEEEYAHLPTATRPAPLALPSAVSERPLEMIGESTIRRSAAPAALEGGVVLRGSAVSPALGSSVVSRGSGVSPALGSSVVSRGSGVSPALGGGVVSRGSGATPLALLPPRRRASPPAPPAPPAPLAPAPPDVDIMRLPIVFADDEAALDEAPVTVTSGSRGYTRVIVASRGVRPGTAMRSGPVAAVRPGPGATVRPGPGVTVRPGPGATVRPGPGVTVRPMRPVLLRRGLRLMPRSDRQH